MTATFWDKRSKKYDDAIKKHDDVYKKTIKASTSLLSSSDTVLDFGCGSGEMSLHIATQVQRLHGIDTSANMIELANQKARDWRLDNVDFSQMGVFDQGLETNSFSAIVAFNIFHLVEDVSKVLARLNDLLAAGGLLISQTPCLGDRNFAFRYLITILQKVGVAPTILSLTTDSLESLVSNAHFEIDESKIWDEKNAIQWIVARKS
jgi:2-polyprenyl-3-methyl-5-hydroxy-6-metoxy-1,4-benzoquinol methylase